MHRTTHEDLLSLDCDIWLYSVVAGQHRGFFDLLQSASSTTTEPIQKTGVQAELVRRLVTVCLQVLTRPHTTTSVQLLTLRFYMALEPRATPVTRQDKQRTAL